jgi:hypothetical protein
LNDNGYETAEGMPQDRHAPVTRTSLPGQKPQDCDCPLAGPSDCLTCRA